MADVLVPGASKWIDNGDGTYAQLVAIKDGEGSLAAQGALTDRSGTLTTGGTAQAAVAANTSRNYLFIRNPISAG